MEDVRINVTYTFLGYGLDKGVSYDVRIIVVSPDGRKAIADIYFWSRNKVKLTKSYVRNDIIRGLLESINYGNFFEVQVALFEKAIKKAEKKSKMNSTIIKHPSLKGTIYSFEL